MLLARQAPGACEPIRKRTARWRRSSTLARRSRARRVRLLAEDLDLGEAPQDRRRRTCPVRGQSTTRAQTGPLVAPGHLAVRPPWGQNCPGAHEVRRGHLPHGDRPSRPGRPGRATPTRGGEDDHARSSMKPGTGDGPGPPAGARRGPRASSSPPHTRARTRAHTRAHTQRPPPCSIGVARRLIGCGSRGPEPLRSCEKGRTRAAPGGVR